MAQRFEWLTSNAKIAYPFVENVDAPSGLEEAIVDAYIVHQQRDKDMPIFLSELRCSELPEIEGSSSSSSLPISSSSSSACSSPYSLVLNGTQYVNVPTTGWKPAPIGAASTCIRNAAQWTYQGWFRVPPGASSGALYNEATSSIPPQTSFIIWIDQITGAIQIQLVEATVIVDLHTTVGSGWNDNQWHYLHIGFDGANYHIYVDGVLDSSPATAGTWPWPTSNIIARRLGYLLNGAISAVRVNDSYLTDASVPTGLWPCSPKHDLFYYPFYEGGGATLNSIGCWHGMDGTLVNNPPWSEFGPCIDPSWANCFCSSSSSPSLSGGQSSSSSGPELSSSLSPSSSSSSSRSIEDRYVGECSLCQRLDIRLTFSDDTLLFDSEDATHKCTAWGQWEVHQWYDDETLVKLVVDPEKLSEYFVEASSSSGESSSSSVSAEPGYVVDIDGAQFVPRCIDVRPDRITSISALLSTIRGRSVDIIAGYNIDLSEVTPVLPTTGPKPKTQIRISAIPGAGAGQYPGCEGVIEEIKTINGVGPDANGNFVLNPKECYWWERPYTVTSTSPRRVTVDPNEIQLHNDCGPCCSCADYVAVYNAMRRVWFYAFEAGEDAQILRQQYNEAVVRWEEEISCRRGVYAAIQMTTKAGWYGGVTAYIRNNTDCTIGPPLHMLFTIGRVEPGEYMRIRYIPGSGWLTTDNDPHYQLDTIDTSEILLDSSSSALPEASVFEFEAEHATIPAGRHAVFRFEYYVDATVARRDNEMMKVEGDFTLGGGNLTLLPINRTAIDTARLLKPILRT